MKVIACPSDPDWMWSEVVVAFATIFAALGVDYKKEYHVGARPIPIVDFGCKPVAEVLA